MGLFSFRNFTWKIMDLRKLFQQKDGILTANKQKKGENWVCNNNLRIPAAQAEGSKD